MRVLIPAAVAVLFALQAQAQTTTTPAPATPAPAAPAPAMTAPATPAPATTMAPASPAPVKKSSMHRMTLQQHFDKVNATHDGHVTKDQAVAGKWSYVSRHFDEMDKDHKGYVTMDDIHAYAHAHHATRKPAAAPAAPATNG